jgi:zinc-binding alcohol dehydrogenase/oxidoreductase
MKALVLDGIKQALTLKEIAKPILEKGEVLVKIKAAAFNRRDWWIQQGKYAGLKFPIVLGSDGSGIVSEVFDAKDEHWIGKNVVINPSNNWGDNENYQSKDFKILGLPDDGTFAEYVKVKAENIAAMPTHLSFTEAAAVPLAGLTAFRALFTKAKLQAGENILIVGVGGGVASFALQWAVHTGANVYVTSCSDDKIAKAKTLGAKEGVNYKDKDWDQQLLSLVNGFDVIIDSSIGESFAKHINYVNPGARIVFFGATIGDLPSINARVLFWKQIQLLGSTLGTAKEFAAMLQFIKEHQIHPVIENVFKLEDAEKAIRLMDNSNQIGKIVLEVS